MRRLALVVCFAGCNPLFGIPGSSQLTPDGPSSSDGSSDGSSPDAPVELSCETTPQTCAFHAIDRPIASAGETIVLEGTFGDSATVAFPGGIVQPVTLLGVHRGTVVVPDNVGSGELTVTTAGRTVGHVIFHGTTFPIVPQIFQTTFDQSNGARQTPELPAPRMNATAVVAKGFLFVIGGLAPPASDALAEVVRAPINADGTLGTFAPAGTFFARGRHCTVVMGDSLYLLGGTPTNAPDGVMNVDRATINADGTLGGVTGAVASLATPRFGHSCVVIGSFLYVIGGFGAGADESVERARISPDGSLGVFEIVPNVKLVTGRVGHTSVVVKNKLYVIGGAGAAGVTPLRSIEQATIDPDGTISTFAVVGSMLVTARSNHVAFATGDSVYVSGGDRGSETVTTDAERAPIDPNGDLGEFVTQTSELAVSRAAPAAAVAGNFVYAIGGYGTGLIGLSTIERASLDGGGALTTFAIATGVTLVSPARSRLSAAVIGSSVFVFGGQIGATSFSNVDGAALGTDGSLGTFAGVPGVALTKARGQHASAVVGNFVYVIGGSDSVNFLDNIERAPINADGSLGAFANFSSSTLSTRRLGHAVIVIRDFVYVIGGDNAGSLAGVERAQFDATGELGAFSDAGISLVKSRSFFGAAVVGNFVYVVGGSNTTSGPLASVERASIAADGSIGAFSTVSGVTLTDVNNHVSLQVIGGFLYVFGDSGPTNVSNTVERAQINPDGTIGNFSLVGGVALETARGRTSSLSAGNFVYVLGGDDGTGALSTVEQAILR